MKYESYRSDIDGIRAISICLVILFHSKILSIGFLGVDIFFVISGFLITTILSKQKKVNIIEFYERRARRLLPVLFIAMFVAIILSFIFLFPFELRDFGQSLISTTFGFSNLLFLKESGYFENTSELKPLLHTWSLSIEQQFYLVFPLIFVYLKKFNHKTFITILIIVIMISFITKLFLLKNFDNIQNIKTEDFNFYFSIFRVWELGIGCLVAIIKINYKFYFSKFINLILSILPIIFLLVLFINHNNNIYNNEVLIFLLCSSFAYLLLNENNLLNKILSGKLLVYVGKISYSLYIWHFIFFSIYRNYSIHKPYLTEYGLLIFLSFIISIITYEYIEKPFRDIKSKFYYSFKFFLIISVITLLSAGLIFHFSNGLPKRFSDDVNNIYQGQLSRNFFQEKCMNKNFKNSCKIGSQQETTSVLWGDSSMDMMLVSFDVFFKQNNKSALVLHNCNDLIFNRKNLTKECQLYLDQIEKKIINDKKIKNIFISHRWKNRISKTDLLSKNNFKNDEDIIVQERKLKSSLELINLLLKNDKKVFLFYPFPEAKYNVPITKSKLKHYGKSLRIGQTIDEYNKRNDLIIKNFDKINHQQLIRIYPNKIFCGTYQKNYCVVEINNISLFSDDNHFTVEGINILFSKIKYLFQL